MFRRKKIAIENNDRLFHEAIIAGNLEKVASLLESYPHLVNQTNTKGDTALSIAVKGGQNGITDLLLKNGGNATHKDTDGTTLLMIACQQDNPVLVRMLLASPTVSATNINKRGKTAFSLALKNGNSYILQALEKKQTPAEKN
tara:strand:+ start:1465 stop:1893 length:429 start_codon:yes stop_codon:yes gene_type:complete